MSKEIKYSGGNITTSLLVVFVVLKLTKLVNWSWWWILSPLWLPFILVVIIAIIMIAVNNDNLR